MASKQNAAYPIDAQFKDNASNIEFRQRYRSKRSFLASVSRSTKATLVHAVDYVNCIVIHPHNLEEYRRG